MTTPLPPADLATRSPEILVLDEGALIERLFSIGFDPIYFDRSKRGRLNAPDSSYGVLYAAAETRGAFAETFLREPGRTLLPTDLVEKRGRAQLRVMRRLRLIKLMGAGLARVGATAEVTHGGLPYGVPQTWSKALRDHPVHCDGIAYRARHDDDAVCYALFDYDPVCVSEDLRETNIVSHDWFWRLMDAYDVGIAP